MKSFDEKFNEVLIDEKNRFLPYALASLIGLAPNNQDHFKYKYPRMSVAQTQQKSTENKTEDKSNLPRGLRNNNPGNIKKSSEDWEGADGDDGTFVKFTSQEYGIRALAKILKNYQKLHNLNTIEEIITRWAPASDNNHTAKYIKYVADKSGYSKNEELNLTDKEVLKKLIDPIIKFENGQGVPLETIEAGIDLS